jgi:hypothetical protein
MDDPIRALFKFMLGEENASLWMTPEAEKVRAR